MMKWLICPLTERGSSWTLCLMMTLSRWPRLHILLTELGFNHAFRFCDSGWTNSGLHVFFCFGIWDQAKDFRICILD